MKLIYLYLDVYCQRIHKRNARHSTCYHYLRVKVVQFGFLALLRPIFGVTWLILRVTSNNDYYLGKSILGTFIIVLSLMGYWINNTYFIHCWIKASARIVTVSGLGELLAKFRRRLILSMFVMSINCIMLMSLPWYYSPFTANIITFFFGTGPF